MDRHYSTLELVKHDETARAPERNWETTAFELDKSALAPQTVPETTPEVSYDNSFPEVHGNIEESTEERAPSHPIPKLALKWPLMVIAFLVAAAIAVGVGVGIRGHSEHSSHYPPAPQSHNITPAAQFILDDTSLAALSLSNGERQLFFQDNSGRIRRTIRSESNSQWSTIPYLNFSTNPKNYTPLAATANYFPENPEVAANIGLYYVSESHNITSAYPFAGSWTTDNTFGNWSTAVDTRSLSFNSLRMIGNSTTTDLALLYYENPNGKASVLVMRGSLLQSNIQWFDISSQESISLPEGFRNAPGYDQTSFTLYESDTNALFSTPFTSAANFTDSRIGALFYSPNVSLENGGPIVVIGYDMNDSPSKPGAFSADIYTENIFESQNYNTIRQSDIAIFGTPYAIWINGTQPVIITQEGELSPGTPNNSFPFTRFSSVTSQSTTYLYHQINGTTFAEEQWDSSEDVWLDAEYITVSDP